MSPEDLTPKKPLEIVDGAPPKGSVAASFGIIFIFAFTFGFGVAYLTQRNGPKPAEVITTEFATLESLAEASQLLANPQVDLEDFAEPDLISLPVTEVAFSAEPVEPVVTHIEDNQVAAAAQIETLSIDFAIDKGLPPLPRRTIPIPGPASDDSFVNIFSHPNDLEGWYASDFPNRNDSFYGVHWDKDNVNVDANGLSLFMTEPRKKSDTRFVSGELRTNPKYSYGRYEAVMRPAKGEGLVSAFFTYTGPYVGDPHDEIDFEFLGKDTTKIHLNYFRKGRRGPNRKVIDLGFDASERPHLYAFNWYEDRIEWYVDNELIHTAYNETDNIPRAPGKIYVSLWTGWKEHQGVQGWHGPYTFGDDDRSHVDCISYRPLGSKGRTCTSVFLGEESFDAQSTSFVDVQQDAVD